MLAASRETVNAAKSGTSVFYLSILHLVDHTTGVSALPNRDGTASLRTLLRGGRRLTGAELAHSVGEWPAPVACPGRSEKEETPMKWTTPRIVEIAVGLEINSYACAELK
jgi:coenzyme PQQ precursor peptide PqqA